MIFEQKDFIPQITPILPESAPVFFHMQTTGHYWRSSAITHLELLMPKAEAAWIRLLWRSEREDDEYEMLEAFGQRLASCSAIQGYNSSSFHIPYLEQKYKAYGLPSPFWNRPHTDLFRELKDTCRLLRISAKLEDIRDFLGLSPECPQIECILCATSLRAYHSFLSGGFSVEDACPLEDSFMVVLKPVYPFPAPFRLHRDAFYLIGEGSSAKIKVRLFRNRVRMYYADYQNYYYLPKEDTAIHKSMAAYIDKEHRIKADSSNCYTYAPYTPSFLQNHEKLKKYLLCLLACP